MLTNALFIPPGAPDARTLADTAAGLYERTSDVESAIAYIQGFGIQLDADTKRYLRAPVLCHHSDWTQDVPAIFFTQARKERFAIVLGAMPGIVGPSEIAIILFAASLCAPLQHDYAELYFWAGGHAMKGQQRPPEEIWSAIGVTLADSDVLDPRGRLYQTYTRFAHDLRSRLCRAKSATNGKQARRHPAPADENFAALAETGTAQGTLPL